MTVHIDDVKPKDVKKCGKCIFCLSKCPNCKSIDVSVEFNYFDTYRYRNNIWNHIYLEKVNSKSSKNGFENRGIVFSEKQQQCFDGLSDYLWVSEISLPNVYTGNKHKLVEKHSFFLLPSRRQAGCQLKAQASLRTPKGSR